VNGCVIAEFRQWLGPIPGQCLSKTAGPWRDPMQDFRDFAQPAKSIRGIGPRIAIERGGWKAPAVSANSRLLIPSISASVSLSVAGTSPAP
jgi:hypothetical protein